MEKWFVINKGADFEKLGKEFGISLSQRVLSETVR